MRKIALAFAATATLSLTGPAGAQVTNYSITGTDASGTVSLDFDGTNYSLSAFNLLVGTPFTTANSGIQPFGSDVLIGANVNGLNSVFSTSHDFLFTMTPGLASQISGIDFGENSSPFVQSGAVTITETGSSGSTTSYSISGDDAFGSVSLDFDGTNYSLSAFDLLVGTPFTTANSGIQPFGGDVLIGANVNGLNSVFSTSHDFLFTMTAGLASQISGIDFGENSSPFVQSADVVIAELVPGVPEPASWAMMLLGFGAIGLAIRRRKVAAFA